MSKPRIYLAGPIGGQTYEGCTGWREYAQKSLAVHNIVGISPMRAKEYLKLAGVIDRNEDGSLRVYDDKPLSSSRGVVVRDRYDCIHCDLVLMNLLDAKEVSKGSMIEIGWADAYRVPIILAMEPQNVHSHAMVEGLVSFHVYTLDDALSLGISVLKDYV